MKDGRRVTDCISVWVLYILSGDYQISTLHHSWLWTMDPGRIKTKIWQQQSWNMGCSGHWTPGLCVCAVIARIWWRWVICMRGGEHCPVTLMHHTEHHLTKWPCISSSSSAWYLSSALIVIVIVLDPGDWWWIQRSKAEQSAVLTILAMNDHWPQRYSVSCAGCAVLETVFNYPCRRQAMACMLTRLTH